MYDLNNVDLQSLSDDYFWYLSNLEIFEGLNDLTPINNKILKNIIDKNIKCNGSLESLELIINYCNDIKKCLEKDVIKLLEEHVDELTEFNVDINYCESTINVINESLKKQYDILNEASFNIYNLHNESININKGLENRIEIVNKLKKFINDVIITPNLIKTLCNDPINEHFINTVEIFINKTQEINKYKSKNYPSVESSIIQIKKLELVLTRRIYDFITLEINKLSLPKTNIQLIQNTNFINIKPLYLYLHKISKYTNDIR